MSTLRRLVGLESITRWSIGPLHFRRPAVQPGRSAGSRWIGVLDLRGPIGLHAAYLQSVASFGEGPVVTPNHPGGFRKWLTQLGLVPRPLAINLDLHPGDAAHPGVGYPPYWHQSPAILGDVGVHRYSVDYRGSSDTRNLVPLALHPVAGAGTRR